MVETIWSQYSCLDAAITRQAWDPIHKEMIETGYQSIFEQTMELYPTLIHMSVRGYKTDLDALNELREKTQDEIREREGELNELCGFALNIDSPKQCANYFYVVKGIKPYTNRKTGKVTCDDKAGKFSSTLSTAPLGSRSRPTYGGRAAHRRHKPHPRPTLGSPRWPALVWLLVYPSFFSPSSCLTIPL